VAVGTGQTDGWLCPLREDDTPAGPAEPVADLAAAVAEWERRGTPRWVWPATPEVYPRLLRAGVRVARCHDLALVEALRLGYQGAWGAPRSLAAAWARLRGLPVPEDPPAPVRERQPTLFDTDQTGLPEGVAVIEAVVAVHADQRRWIASCDHPERVALLAAVESAGALAAAEMGQVGLPWRADIHDAVLTDLLGPRPAPGMPPAKLAALAERITAAFGGRPVNPDSPADVVRAFAREGILVPSTRSHVLRRINHPAVPPLLEYKELSRLMAAHGWAWLSEWVRDGRFRPEYIAGGVVSGRWATRGGGALQIPRVVRRAVVADPGWVFVVADAAQLEPRVLAALSGDRRLADAASAGDLYTALAADAFGGDRPRAKVALLAAMYGQTSGEAAASLAILRRRFPVAWEYLEAAARVGERGGLVRSRLGRTCPPPMPGWREADTEARAQEAIRSRGRFTRNFVIQASAADFALTWLADLRQRLAGLRAGTHGGAQEAAPELVFFQHDEVLVHCPRRLAADVAEAVQRAAVRAGQAVFGDSRVRFPVDIATVECYADAR